MRRAARVVRGPAQQRGDRARIREVFVAAEARLALDGNAAAHVDAELARGLRLSALRFHRLLEAFLIEREPALARDICSEIDGKAEGVVQPERGFAGDLPGSQ
jgi:hypothetical protein